MRKIAADLLTVLCYTQSSRGHQLVYQALSMTGKLHRETANFQIWMHNMQASINAREKVGGIEGMVAGVGWVGEEKVTDREILDEMVRR